MSKYYLPPGMRHVERRELYTSFTARLNYLHSFLEFGLADVQILQKAQPFIKTLIPTVAELVYNKLLENDLTAQALITQKTTEENELDADDFFDKRSSNVKHRHLFVRWYLTKLNDDPARTEYWEYMNKVGAMHNGLLRRQPLQIDVIHFSAMIGHVQNILNEAIITSNVIPAADKAPLVKAWGKLLWVQNDLFAKWHVKDGDMYEQSDPEAMKLLREEVKLTSNDMKDDEGRPVQCPFQGVAQVRTIESMGAKKEGYTYKHQDTQDGSNHMHSFRASMSL